MSRIDVSLWLHYLAVARKRFVNLVFINRALGLPFKFTAQRLLAASVMVCAAS